jgi:hypothetical protein
LHQNDGEEIPQRDQAEVPAIGAEVCQRIR